MKFAILAAGEGSRLSQEGIDVPKPLVSIHGEPLIDRLIRIFTHCGAEEIVIIVNNLTTAVQEHLQALHTPVPLRVVVETTPSSMHSMAILAPHLQGGKFCLTTVDTIFRESEFRDFITHFQTTTLDGVMAVTDYVDDEKPLWVSTAKDTPRITGFFDSQADFQASAVAAHSTCTCISGGIYCLTHTALDTLQRCLASGQSRMRNYQRSLVAEGQRLEAYLFTKILDVDHVSDIQAAEQFLSDETHNPS